MPEFAVSPDAGVDVQPAAAPFQVIGAGVDVAPAPSQAAAPQAAPGRSNVHALLGAKAEQYNVSPDLVFSIAKNESNFNPNAVSPKGAVGVMQLVPSTARSLGVTDLYDPEQNIDAGVRHLARLSNKYGGDTRLIAAAYNAGEGAVDRAGGVPNYPETRRYVTNVLKTTPANISMPEAAPSGAPSGDILSRFLGGENIPLTEENIRAIMGGVQPAPAAAPQPATVTPQPAAPAKVPFQVVGEGVSPTGTPEYHFPKPTYQSWIPQVFGHSPIPAAFGKLDEVVQDSIDYMADGLMRAYKAPSVDEKLAGLSETLHGVFNGPAMPFLLEAAGSAPVRTAIGLGAGVGVQKGVEAAAPKIGAGPGASAFAGDVAGLITGLLTGRLGRGGGETPPPGAPPGGEGGGAPPPPPPPGGPRGGIEDLLNNEKFRNAIKLHPKGRILFTLYDTAKWLSDKLTPTEEGPAAKAPPAAPPSSPAVTVPSPTPDEALMLRHLGVEDPGSADADTIATARQLITEHPEVMAKLRGAGPPLEATLTSPENVPLTTPAPVEALDPKILEAVSQKSFGGKSYAELSPEDQLEIRRQAEDYQRQGKGPADVLTVEPATAPAAAQPAAPSMTTTEMAQALSGERPPSKLSETQKAEAQAVLSQSQPAAPASAPVPQAPPASPPVAIAEPTAAEVSQPRVDALTDFVKKNVPPQALAGYNAHEWGMLGEAAGVDSLTPDEIAAVRSNIADWQASKPSNVPAEAEAQFEEQKAGVSPYTETGELKSKTARATEMRTARAEAKAQRWADALSKLGLTAADVERLESGQVSAEALRSGAPAGWDNVMHDLIAKGLLESTERNPPQSSLPRILEILRAAEAKKPAPPVIAAKPGMKAPDLASQIPTKGLTRETATQAFEQAKAKPRTRRR